MKEALAVNHLKKSDRVLGQLIERIGVYQLSKRQLEGDLFFCLSRSILHQQLSTKVAQIIHTRFLQLYCETQRPTAVDVLNTPDEVLRRVGISRPKIAYLKDLARHEIAGLPTLEELQTWEDEAIIETLTRVKGIGRWTVQMLLIFDLKRWDVWPVDDLGVRNALQKLYGFDTLPNRQMTEQIGQKWKPYRSVVAWYLWQSLTLNASVKPLQTLQNKA
jgi:DNA-3-methyladenine glycosylase II